MSSFNLLLLPGDGIGAEVSAEVEKIITWMSKQGIAKFELERGLVGGCAYDADGKATSEEDMAKAQDLIAQLCRRVGREPNSQEQICREGQPSQNENRSEKPEHRYAARTERDGLAIGRHSSESSQNAYQDGHGNGKS